MPADLGDRDDDPTKPDCLDAILANAALRFIEGARSIGVAVPLLCRLADSDREYFAGRLADDIDEFLESSRGFAELVRFAGGGER